MSEKLSPLNSTVDNSAINNVVIESAVRANMAQVIVDKENNNYKLSYFVGQKPYLWTYLPSTDVVEDSLGYGTNMTDPPVFVMLNDQTVLQLSYNSVTGYFGWVKNEIPASKLN